MAIPSVQVFRPAGNLSPYWDSGYDLSHHGLVQVTTLRNNRMHHPDRARNYLNHYTVHAQIDSSHH